MEGGKLIGTGSMSCVFNPNLPCLNGNEKDIKSTKISKVIYRKNAKKYSTVEKNIHKKIEKIKGYKKWALIYDNYCKPLPLRLMKSYDSSGVRKCLESTSHMDDSYFDENSYMMVGNYGGQDLDNYFNEKFMNISSTNLEKEFLKLMKMMKPLFLGAKKMKLNGIIHNDIKGGNIIVHNDTLKYIDFGLSGTINNKKHFSARSRREFSTSRIYLYYSIEYLFYYTENEELNKEFDYIVDGNHRYNYDVFEEIIRMFGHDPINIIDLVIEKIQFNEVDEKEMIE